jgi:superfamily II DNA/RNA helicase
VKQIFISLVKVNENVSLVNEPKLNNEGPANNYFSSLSVDASIHNALKEMGFKTMTPIQAQCIPVWSLHSRFSLAIAHA